MANSETDVEVKIGGDASGAAAAAEDTKVNIKAVMQAVADAAAAFKSMGATAVGSLHESAVAAKETAAQVKELGESVKEFREMLSGIGELMMAAFAVEAVAHFAEGMAELAEKTAHAASTFGLTTSEIQGLRAEAAATGVPFEAITTGMMRMDKAFLSAKEGAKAPTEAFKTLGISTSESLTQTQLFQRALAGFTGMDAGPAKVALAMQLFGKNIQAIGPMLGLTKEQLAEITVETEEYGAVSDDAEAKGLALAESFNVQHVAMLGLGNSMAEAFAPALKAVVDGMNDMIKGFMASYKAGGAAKTVMDILSATFKVLAEVVATLGEVFIFTFDTIDGAVWAFQGIIAAVVDAVIGGVRAMMDAFKSFGDVMRDVFTLNWGNIAADIKTGAARVASDVVATATKMGADAAEGFKRGGDSWAAGDKSAGSFMAWSKKLWSPGESPSLPKEGLGTTGDDPAGDGKHKKGSGPDTTAADQAAKDAADDAKAQAREEIAAAQEAAQEQIQFIKDTLTARVEADNESIRSVQQSEREGLVSHREAHDQILKLVSDRKEAEDEAALQILQTTNATEDQILATAKWGSSERIAATKAEAAAWDLYERTRATSTRQANATINQEDQAASAQRVAAWKASVTSMVDAWGTGISGMIQGTTTFGQFVNKIWVNMLDGIIKMIEQMVVKWIMHETVKTAATVAGAGQRVAAETVAHTETASLDFLTTIKTVTNAAVKAAAGAYAALAGIPIIGPALGAAAAAVTFVAVEGLGAMASASGGYDIPTGVNPVTQLHQEEMVLPATLANPMRSMLASFGAGGTSEGGGTSAGGGDSYHVNVTAFDAVSVDRMLRGPVGDQIVKGLIAKKRQGQGAGAFA